MHSAQTGRRDDQFAIAASRFLGLCDPCLGEPLVASAVALVHRQQALVVGEHPPGSLRQMFHVASILVAASLELFAQPFARGGILRGVEVSGLRLGERFDQESP